MGNLESVEDVLRCAISREVEANVFFNLLSQYIDDVRLRSVCSELAMEELEHKAKLELELMKLGRVVRPLSRSGSGIGPPLRPLDYMVDMAKVMRMDLRELLLVAIEKEKASFRLYVDFLSTVKNEECRQALAEIAEEEARHKMRFEIEYDRLLAGQQEPLA